MRPQKTIEMHFNIKIPNFSVGRIVNCLRTTTCFCRKLQQIVSNLSEFTELLILGQMQKYTLVFVHTKTNIYSRSDQQVEDFVTA